MKRSRPSGRRSSRATEWPTEFLAWPFFDARHRELATKLEDWCEAHDPRCAGGGRGCRLPGDGRRARQGGLSEAVRRRRGRPARRAQPRDRARDLRSLARAGRFRLRDARPRLGRDQPVRNRRAEARMAAARRQWRGDRGLRHDRARMRVGRGQHVHLRHARGQRMGAGRREDANLQRRHRGFLRDLRAHGRGRRRARPVGFHRPAPRPSPLPSGSRSSRRIRSRG